VFLPSRFRSFSSNLFLFKGPLFLFRAAVCLLRQESSIECIWFFLPSLLCPFLFPAEDSDLYFYFSYPSCPLNFIFLPRVPPGVRFPPPSRVFPPSPPFPTNSNAVYVLFLDLLLLFLSPFLCHFTFSGFPEFPA